MIIDIGKIISLLGIGGPYVLHGDRHALLIENRIGALSDLV
ncbi:MAG: hypothetical protein BWY40_00414 [bacterium ADurb.Bin270]|nr:MAG: hypothetical protein BWY40_00414 [bacterium ADurb.Bin270]